MRSLIDAAGTLVRRHSWWMVPSFVAAIAVGLVFGYVAVWIGYAAFNNVGVWLAVDSQRFTRRGRRSWMAWCAMVLLPAGLVGLLVTGEKITPIEAVALASPDEDTRKETARAMSRGVSGPFGSM